MHAFGESTNHCLEKIEEEIIIKYKQIKQKFLKTYEKKFQEIMKPLSQHVETLIRSDTLKRS